MQNPNSNLSPARGNWEKQSGTFPGLAFQLRLSGYHLIQVLFKLC